jgi:tRNA (Thr-GGU) A37 N-methylase
LKLTGLYELSFHFLLVLDNISILSCFLPSVEGIDPIAGILHVDGLDLINDTPVLDIKPYIPAFDAFPSAKAGWMDQVHPDPLYAREHGYQGFRKL